MNGTAQRLTRSRTDRMLAGVAGGLAHYFGVDPVIVRLAFVLLSLSGPGALIYILMWVITPEEPLAGAPVPPGGKPAVGQTQSLRMPSGEEHEIPIQNLGGPAASPEARSRTLGQILMVVGAFLLLKLVAPPLLPLLLPAIIIGAGVLLLRRAR